MKKIKLKTFIAFTSLLVPSTLVLPIVTSACVSSNDWNYQVDETNNQILVNSNFLSNTDNSSIFKTYQYLIQNMSNPSFIAKLNESLNTFTNNFLENYVIDWNSIQLDLTNFKITIDVKNKSSSTFLEYSIIKNTVNNQNEIKKLSIVFPKYADSSISDFLNNNTSSFSKTNFLTNYSLEDILNPEVVTDEQILVAANLNLNTTKILYKMADNKPTTRLGKITNDSTENVKSLNLLFFDSANNSKGLGQIIVSQKEVEVRCIPSKSILNVFGVDVKNDFIEIIQDQSKYPDVNEWKYNADSTITPILPMDNLLLTYSDFLNINQDVNNKIETYNLANFQKDYEFFVNKYFSDIFANWNIPSLYTTGLYSCNNIKYDEKTKTFNGSIGLNIYNKSTLTKELSLPISNEKITIDGNSNIVILLELNNSKISPTLVPNTQIKNTANLTPSFSNVTIKYQISKNETQSQPINWLSLDKFTNSEWIQSSFNNVNLFTNSLSLMCLIEKVTIDKNFIESLGIIEENKKTVTESQLKNLKLEQLTNSYNTTSIVVKSVESLMLKIVKNPTIYDLLQDISFEIYNIVNATINNQDIANLISQLFTRNSTSIYLLNNINSIINIMKSIDDGSSTQLTEIIKLLSEIINNHNDPIKMHQWVASIEGLYPTLEKLLDKGAQWILPMIGEIMRGLSQDKPIIEFLFNNIDFVLTYLSQDSLTNNLGSSTQTIIKSVHNYLNNLVTYSASIYPITKSNVRLEGTTIKNTLQMQEKYKKIHALDIFTYELTNKNSANSILTLVSGILAPIDPATANILKTVSSILANNVNVSQTINDYTNATFENVITTTQPTGLIKKIGTYSLDETTGYKVISSGVTTTLSEQIGKCIDSLFHVTYGGKQMLLSEVLNSMGNAQSNINMEVINNFQYSNFTVTQDLEIKYSFKQDLKWNLLPISCLLDNIKIEINDSDFDNLINYINTKIPESINALVTISKSNVRSWLYLFAGISFTDYTDNVGTKKLVLDLTRIFPTDLTIKPENNFILQYKANNAPIYPIVTEDGTINWGYNSFENILFNDKSVLDNANQDFVLNSASEAKVKVSYKNSSSESTYALNISYTKDDLKTEQLDKLKAQKYYGCQYLRFKKFLFDQVKITEYSSNLPTLLSLAIAAILPNKPIIFNPEPSTTNIASIFQTNTTPNIKDYNTNVFNPNYSVGNVGKGDVDLVNDLTNFVNNYIVWNNSQVNPNQQILTMEPNTLDALNQLVKKHYNISNSINFQVGISGQVVQILNKKYSYNLCIYFDRPVLYTYTDSLGNLTKSIVQQIIVPFTMNTVPTKPQPTPPTTTTLNTSKNKY